MGSAAVVYMMNSDGEHYVANDITGKRFGHLTALGPEQTLKDIWGIPHWRFVCDCGELRWFNPVDVIKATRSVRCSCPAGRAGRKYREYPEKKRLVRILRGMVERCTNPKSHAYRWYGARGISIDPFWHACIEYFIAWSFANGYRSDLTIDRIDNRRGYWPDNCRWATFKEQANNKLVHQERREWEAFWKRPMNEAYDVKKLAGLMAGLG